MYKNDRRCCTKLVVKEKEEVEEEKRGDKGKEVAIFSLLL
jgi:hypothetical protein